MRPCKQYQCCMKYPAFPDFGECCSMGIKHHQALVSQPRLFRYLCARAPFLKLVMVAVARRLKVNHGDPWMTFSPEVPPRASAGTTTTGVHAGGPQIAGGDASLVCEGQGPTAIGQAENCGANGLKKIKTHTDMCMIYIFFREARVVRATRLSHALYCKFKSYAPN